jgi:hypothetical protein
MAMRAILRRGWPTALGAPVWAGSYPALLTAVLVTATSTACEYGAPA